MRQLSARPGAIVFATSRDPEASAAKFKPLTDQGNVHVVKITKQPEAIDESLKAAELVKKIAGKVDVVVSFILFLKQVSSFYECIFEAGEEK